ncbi:MAG: adenylate kinase [Candidatus Parcubacteria bacterium]|nr:MAG: adenylate kinase [Candidatus Parcubacteria bacterium]
MNKVFFLTGPPLSGKDTQGKLLAKKIKGKFLVTHILVDKFFKKQKKGYVKIGKKFFSIKKEIERRFQGGLYSPEIIGYVVAEKIKELVEKYNLVFSGSPRMIEEAKIEIKTLKDLGIDFRVIFLNVSEEEIFKRAKKRKREKEDDPEIVKKRISNFKKYVLPTVNFLKKRGCLIEVNGEGDIKEIHKKIITSLF